MDGHKQLSRILLECTLTSRTNVIRGIPRVVRGIVEHAGSVAAKHDIATLPICYAFNGWVESSLGNCDEQPAECQWPSKTASAFANSICRVVPSAMLRRQLLPPSGRDGVWKLPRKLSKQTRLLQQQVSQPSVAPGHGDALVLLDSWLRTPASFWRNVAHARRRGATVVSVVYDLIPITHPQYVSEKCHRRFAQWLKQTALHSDLFAAISGTVKNELRSYLTRHFPSQSWPQEMFTSFILGAQLPAFAADTVSDEISRAFAAGNTYLMVGTLEQRKNQAFLLDAFELLWERGVDVRLCLVGAETQSVPELMRRLREHPERNRRLFLYSSLNDAELDYCYRHATALAYPSITEGFGLPIIEALQHRKLVLASDTAIHREVGRDFCLYFDLKTPESLSAMIETLERANRNADVRPADEFVAPTWERSCRELFGAIRRTAVKESVTSQALGYAT